MERGSRESGTKWASRHETRAWDLLSLAIMLTLAGLVSCWLLPR